VVEVEAEDPDPDPEVEVEAALERRPAAFRPSAW